MAARTISTLIACLTLVLAAGGRPALAQLDAPPDADIRGSYPTHREARANAPVADGRGEARTSYQATPVEGDAADRGNGLQLETAAPKSLSAPLLLPKSQALRVETTRNSNSGHEASAVSIATPWTMVGSTCLVLTIFVAFALIMRRTIPKGMQTLPTSVFEVLGRSAIAKGQTVQLLRCGNKLLLVATSLTATETLTEVTDENEVERVVALCRPETNGRSLRATSPGFEDGAKDENLDIHLPRGGRPSPLARHRPLTTLATQ